LKKKWVIRAAAIILSVVLLGALGIYYLNTSYSTDAYKHKWNIMLPDDLKKQYSAQDIGFTGDGLRYNIFKLGKNVPSFIDSSSTEKNAEMEADVNKALAVLKIDKNNYPNFSHNYRWMIPTDNGGLDKMYIIYDPEADLVYFLESII
jgi:hypothetical protein